MSKDTIADRSTLLKAAQRVRPALAGRDYIPALTHIAFDGEWATAFNDVLAVGVRCNADIRRLIPGDLLVQGLSAFGGKEVLFHQDNDDSFVMKSGRARLKLPTLALKDFPFDWPETDGPWIEFDLEMVAGIKRCLISVNKDATQPAQLGVTMDVTPEGRAVFFSTDNGSVSRYECKTKIKLPGEAPIIMPRAFCDQLIDLCEAYPKCMAAMCIGSGWLQVQYEEREGGAAGSEARLYTTMPTDLDPLDFPKMLRRHCGDLETLGKRTTIIPESFDVVLSRALLVLGSESRKKAMVMVDDGLMRMTASTPLGESDDTLPIDLAGVGPVPMEAGFVSRALKLATRIGITETVTILVGGERGEFVHMVAHVRDVK